MTTYILSWSCSVEGLENSTNNLMKSGWVPIGGVAVTFNDYGEPRKFYQAMVRTIPQVVTGIRPHAKVPNDAGG